MCTLTTLQFDRSERSPSQVSLGENQGVTRAAFPPGDYTEVYLEVIPSFLPVRAVDSIRFPVVMGPTLSPPQSW